MQSVAGKSTDSNNGRSGLEIKVEWADFDLGERESETEEGRIRISFRETSFPARWRSSIDNISRSFSNVRFIISRWMRAKECVLRDWEEYKQAQVVPHNP